jgi:serine/threonine protein phosphatase PrpC
MYRDANLDVANLCGATAVVCLIVGNRMFCANVGDARAVLCRNGKAIDMSRDHKSSDLEE